MAALKFLKNKLGEVFLPITHFRAVRNDEGVNLETELQKYQQQGEYYSE